ncbi:MAG: hypothetical protein HOF74_08235 [Gammaproteobacteria bacterium]|jgi:predicted  nucleic acid-binding Zn-ribbon protein|nr:hypothetical protein [Gammaproteobacteria bacterium]MBT3859802.1 hypothetical protein [Gammaproteobacteria bacterium]MBT3988868.1 hypothetical protein [Gammaproteobacteria bacterium]MBT4580902.1 hypothetical protein [Gammaproteobacteria bacterium]MBT4660232.1 hypothetical protein [Gammaproteobacteria bacterium]
MKAVEIVGVAIVLGGMSYAIVLAETKSGDLQEQLDIAMGFQTQLQEQAEEYALQRNEFEAQLSSLQSQLLSASNQLANMSAELQSAREKINPDYEELLEQVRAQVAQESGPRRRGGPSSSPFSDPAVADSWAQDSVPGLYRDYVNALALPEAGREDILDAMVDFTSQRYQMLGELLDGNLSADQAVAMFGPDGMVNGMEELLSDDQLDELSQYDRLIKQDTAREIYGEGLSRSGSSIEGLAHEQVMDTVIDELFSSENNYSSLVADDGSMSSAHEDSVQAYERARERLQPDLDVDQLEQYDQFVRNQTSGIDIILEATSRTDGEREIRHARIGADDLPN